MALNLNSNPYYDDFDSTKNYNRVLFKPGVAVQARELTQLQTALSDQLSQLGSFSLKDGAIISGCEETLVNYKYIKVTDSNVEDDPISNTSMIDYVGATLIGEDSGIKAKIITYKTGSINDDPSTKTFYISYTDENAQINTDEVKYFQQGETLIVDSPNSAINKHTFVAHSTPAATDGSRDFYRGRSPHVTLSAGIIYALGAFIRTKKITTFIDDYTVLTNKKVGFLVTPSIVQYTDDETLLDPARGTYNRSAPGADRLQHTVTLVSYNEGETIPENFFLYGSYENGVFTRSKIQLDTLGDIRKIIAEEAYNTNGNYIIEGLQTYFQEHLYTPTNGGRLPAASNGDATKLVANIRSGKANISGYPVELPTDVVVPVNKPTAFRTEQGVTQSTSYGNYVIVNENSGAWDIDGGDEASGSGTVDLYNTPLTSVTSGTFGATTVSSANKVGTAKTRHLVLHSGDSGTSSAQYKLYLYDIKMSVGNFSAVKSIGYESDITNAFADIVLNDNSEAQLYETNFNKLLWNLPYSFIKTLKANDSAFDYNFIFTREFELSVNSLGQINVPSGNAYQTFFYGEGLISPTLVNSNMLMVATSTFTLDGTEITKGQFIDLTNKVTQIADNTLSINLGSEVTDTPSNVRLYVNMKTQNNTIVEKSLELDKYIKIDTIENENYAKNKFCLGVSDVVKVKQILATDNPDYDTGLQDVTRDFVLDNGQRENFYGLAHIQKRSGSSLDLSTKRYIVVKFDYFISSTSGSSFACVDSYPVDDTGEVTDQNTIRTEEIPLFSSSNGGVYDLKNAIDFRPYMSATVTPSSDKDTVDDNDINPKSTEITDRPTNGLTNPVPVQEFTTDLEYYIGEAYKVVMTSEGNPKVLKGLPSTRPRLPETPPGAMVLAHGVFPPYPCLAQDAARPIARPDLALSTTLVRNKRYTMRDIGALEERISNLEYYTTLSLLEKQAGEVKILDSEGIDRFKNGYMIDSFATFGVNSVTHQDNNCSIDKTNRELRAAFKASVVGFKPLSLGSTVGQTGDIFHVPYDEVLYASQIQASKYRNVIGETLVTPRTDTDTDNEEDNSSVPPAEPQENDTDSSVVPVANTDPGYYLIRSATSVNEGSSFTITLETQNIEEGTLIPYEITGVTTADINGAALSGNFEVSSAGTAFLDINVTADAETEGTETFTITLTGVNSPVSGSPIFTTVVINDTSTTPVSTPEVAPAPNEYIGTGECIPPRENWHDINSAPIPYNNDNGEYDHLVAGSLPTPDGTTSGWTREWGNWNPNVSTTRGGEYPGIQHGVEWDGTTEEVQDGLYVPSYGVVWVNEQTIPADTVTAWDVRTGEWVWKGPTRHSETVRVEAETDVFLRPITIEVKFRGLKPRTTHRILVNNRQERTIFSDAAGNIVFDLTFQAGETRLNGSGRVIIQAVNQNYLGEVDSFANVEFYASYTRDAVVETDLSLRWTRPSSPVIPQVFSRTLENTSSTVTGRVGGDRVSDRSTVTTGETSQTLDVVTSNGVVTAKKVAFEELDLSDYEVDSQCVNGISTATMRRPSGEEYYVELVDPGCKVYNGYKASQSPSRITEDGETVDLSGNATTQQSASSVGFPENTDTTDRDITTGAGNVSTVSSYNHSEGSVRVDSLSENSTFTTGITSSNTGTNLRTGNNTIDGSTDPDLLNIASNMLDFDINIADLWCAEAGIGSRAIDPLAQTFYVEEMPGGMYITSADIFFRTISSEENNNGIKLQIREVINGAPSTTIVASGESYKTRSQCFVSTTDAEGNVSFVSTNFAFDVPVYLKNNTEYCMVLVPDADDPGYEVWIGELGGTQIGTSTRITKQAHSGVLFTSANNRSWSAHQSEDLMFALRRAKFEVNQDYILNTTNKNVDWVKFDSSTWNTDLDDDNKMKAPKFSPQDSIHGFTITIEDPGEYTGTGIPTLEVKDGGGTGATLLARRDTSVGNGISEIEVTSLGSGYTSDPRVTVSVTGSDLVQVRQAVVSIRLNRAVNKFYDRGQSCYELLVSNGYFTVGDRVSNGITDVEISSIDNRKVSAHVIEAHTINPDNRGTIIPKIALTDTGSTSANNTYSDVRLRETVELPAEKTIYSYSNEARPIAEGGFAGSRTSKLQYTFRTSSNNVAPMIDMAAMDMLAIVNSVNYPETVEEEVSVGGNAISKYISRQVVLASGQDAEDFKVFLDNAIPKGTAVEVYAKFKNSEDDGDFLTDINWKKLEVDESPFVPTQTFAEYTYKIPEKSTGVSGLNAEGIFEYDVQRLARISVDSGGSGFSTKPIVKIVDSAGTGYGATAEATISGGVVTGITIVNPGRNYTGSITATLSDVGQDTEAVLTAEVETVTYTRFKYFAVKIVHLSDNSAIIPRSSGLRAYALQA